MLVFWRCFAYLGVGLMSIPVFLWLGHGMIGDPKHAQMSCGAFCCFTPGMGMLLFGLFAHWLVKSKRANARPVERRMPQEPEER